MLREQRWSPVSPRTSLGDDVADVIQRLQVDGADRANMHQRNERLQGRLTGALAGSFAAGKLVRMDAAVVCTCWFICCCSTGANGCRCGAMLCGVLLFCWCKWSCSWRNANGCCTVRWCLVCCCFAVGMAALLLTRGAQTSLTNKMSEIEHYNECFAVDRPKEQNE